MLLSEFWHQIIDTYIITLVCDFWVLQVLQGKHVGSISYWLFDKELRNKEDYADYADDSDCVPPSNCIIDDNW